MQEYLNIYNACENMKIEVDNSKWNRVNRTCKDVNEEKYSFVTKTKIGRSFKDQEKKTLAIRLDATCC